MSICKTQIVVLPKAGIHYIAKSPVKALLLDHLTVLG